MVVRKRGGGNWVGKVGKFDRGESGLRGLPIHSRCCVAFFCPQACFVSPVSLGFPFHFSKVPYLHTVQRGPHLGLPYNEQWTASFFFWQRPTTPKKPHFVSICYGTLCGSLKTPWIRYLGKKGGRAPATSITLLGESSVGEGLSSFTWYQQQTFTAQKRSR